MNGAHILWNHPASSEWMTSLGDCCMGAGRKRHEQWQSQTASAAHYEMSSVHRNRHVVEVWIVNENPEAAAHWDPWPGSVKPLYNSLARIFSRDTTFGAIPQRWITRIEWFQVLVRPDDLSFTMNLKTSKTVEYFLLEMILKKYVCWMLTKIQWFC